MAAVCVAVGRVRFKIVFSFLWGVAVYVASYVGKILGRTFYGCPNLTELHVYMYMYEEPKLIKTAFGMVNTKIDFVTNYGRAGTCALKGMLCS